jgi:UDP-glucose:(heptosyl)LPS alpha-1,3-glucosyltransferase
MPYKNVMNKKVALITERANIALGGAERSVFELAGVLSSTGLEIHLLAATGETTGKNTHILCNRTTKRKSFKKFEKALREHLSNNKYDIIHSVLPFDFTDIYQPRGGTYAEALLRNAASYENKFVKSYKKLTAPLNLRRSTLLQAERNLCERFDGPIVVALSQYVVNQLKQHYKTNMDRIILIHNGVKTISRTDRKSAERLRTQILGQLGLKEADNPILLLFVANNFRLKGLKSLIKALHLVTINNQAKKNVSLIVAGKGKARKYRHLAKTLNIQNKILFLGHIKRIKNLISIADVAVLPTFYDPCSRFILEALAAGKPVITTSFNGASELFVKDKHGKLISTPDDIAALADAISYFSDPENIQKASNAILADNLKEIISINRAAKQLISVYESILQKKGL